MAHLLCPKPVESPACSSDGCTNFPTHLVLIREVVEDERGNTAIEDGLAPSCDDHARELLTYMVRETLGEPVEIALEVLH